MKLEEMLTEELKLRKLQVPPLTAVTELLRLALSLTWTECLCICTTVSEDTVGKLSVMRRGEVRVCAGAALRGVSLFVSVPQILPALAQVSTTYLVFTQSCRTPRSDSHSIIPPSRNLRN